MVEPEELPGIPINDWCDAHWQMLREAVFARGMGHLVPADGAAAAAMLVDEIKHGTARDSEGFDPLMRAYWAISGRVLEAGGDLFHCPLCQVQAHVEMCHEPTCQNKGAQDMVDSCTDSLREYVRSKGLLRDDA